MEILRGIIRNIVIIIVLATFLEMLLPSSTMKKYVKLVIGLFIIVTILAPVLSLINQNYSFSLGDYQITSAKEVNDILAKGNSLRVNGQNQAQAQYKTVLAKQIQGIAQLNSSLTIENVELKLISPQDNKTLANGINGIDEVTLVINKNPPKNNQRDKSNSPKDNQSTDKTVQPVTIRIGEINTNLSEGGKTLATLNPKEQEKLIDVLANIYNLKPNQIKFIEK
jgi:stage III sporulation protein AF